MNAPKIIELCVYEILQQFGAMGGTALLRPWRTLTHNPQWKGRDSDKVLPCVDIRCSSAAPNEEQDTQTCAVTVECRTHNEDDPSHALVAAMEEVARDVLEDLRDQCRLNSGEVWEAFKEQADTLSENKMIIGDVSFDGTAAPYDDDGVNVATVGATVHFAKRRG
jgi:hypothetical protein